MIDLTKPIAFDEKRRYKIFYTTDGGISLTEDQKYGSKLRAFNRYNFNIENKLGICFQYVYNITGNCQLSSFCNFESVLKSSDIKELFIWTLQEISKKSLMKNIAIFDIKNRDGNSDKMTLLFGDYIMHKHDYISTNGSSMMLYMVKINDFLKNNQ